MATLLGSTVPDFATRDTFKIRSFLGYVGLHLFLLAAPFTFTWAGLALMVLVKIMTGCLGITLCYHRLLAHRSYKTPLTVRRVLAVCGVLACQRGPIWWTATHRTHHAFTDKPQDPHTPAYSFWWSHLLWAFFRNPQLDESPQQVARLARDIAEDPFMRFLENNYELLNAAFVVLLFGAGYALGGMKLGLSFFIWGGPMRMLASLHSTWFVNSAAHVWGYRNYETGDTSRNNWWVAFLTFGEGWHNNHHADARAARNGHHWYELDMTYGIILLMRKLGWASDLVAVSNRLDGIALRPVPSGIVAAESKVLDLPLAPLQEVHNDDKIALSVAER